jgi:hypothetical protein
MAQTGADGLERNLQSLAAELQRLQQEHARFADTQVQLMAVYPQIIREVPRIALGKIPPRRVDVEVGPRGGLRYAYRQPLGFNDKVRYKYLKGHEVLKCAAGTLNEKAGICTLNRNPKPVKQIKTEKGKRYGKVVFSILDNDTQQRLAAESKKRTFIRDYENMQFHIANSAGSLPVHSRSDRD